MKKCFYLLLALLAFTATAWAQFSGGHGTDADPYLISSTADWNTLADYVNNGNDDYKASCYLLTDDISVTKMVGKEGKYFEGTFDGDGHTLTVSFNISSYDDDGVAPFRFLKNATIKKLHVAGKIKSNSYYIGGIAGYISGSCNFYACRSSVNITSKFSDHYSGFHGGLVGQITYGPHTFVNCLYDGRIEVVCCDYVGGLFGNLKTEEGGVEAEVSVINCMFAPSGYYISHCEYVGDLVPRRTNLPSTILHFCHTDKDFGDEEGWDAYGCLNQQLLDYLGDGWHEVDGKVVPNYAVEVNFSFDGEGTHASPYLINNTDDWHKLYMNVLLNNTYRKHYKLTDDITLTDEVVHELPSTMLGSTEDVSFNGTFDGDGHTITLDYKDYSDKHYCGPFRVIKDANIMNLHVTGIIYKAKKKHVGGLVGKAYGSNYIENCRSSVTIIANTDGDGSHGGFIGDLRGGSTTFHSCIFDGKMEGSGGSDSRTTKWGGFVGWVADGKEANFYNCLFAPAEIHISNTNGSRTFARRNDGDDVTFTNSYYFQTLGSSQAKHARSISGNENVNMTSYSTSTNPHVYNVSGITTYSNGFYNVNSGLEYRGVYYAGNGDEVLLNLSQIGNAPTGTTANSFIATPGSLSGTQSPYTLTMPDADVTISLAPSDWNTHAGTAADPYPIYTTEQWNLLANRVNNESQTYSGKFFKLMADITVTETVSSGTPTTMVGTSDSKSFQGTFDGNGHTITLNYNDTRNADFCAPFCYINGATIKYLHVDGTIYKTQGKNAGGLVGKAVGNNTIANCRSSVDIQFNKSGDVSSSGFIGELRESGNTTLNNCLFDGKLHGTNDNDCWGGFIGWVADGRTAIFKNCLFKPAVVPSTYTDGDNKTFARKHSNGHVDVNNCYYTQKLGNDAQDATNATGYENEALRFGLGHGWEIVTEMEINGTDTTYVEKVVPIMKKHSLSGDGTLASPYLINSEDDWNGLASNVFLGETYSGQYIQLTNDIIVNRMIGTGTNDPKHNTYSFSGTFNGDGNTLTFDYSTNVGSEGLIAPFRFVDGATIQNLVVDGTIVASNKYAAGIIGRVDGNTTLNNCRSSIIINSSVSGEGGHGGLVGLVLTGSVLTIDGCLFDGKLLGSGTTHCGGLVGEAFKDENSSSTVNITNSLCAPAELTVDTTGSSTLVGISNGNTNITATNSYYKQAFGTTQGKQARSISEGEGVTVAFANDSTAFDISGITSYGVGIKYNDKLYAGNGDAVSLNLGEASGFIHTGNFSTTGGGSLSGTSNPYTLTMPDADVTINAVHIVSPWHGIGTEDDPFLIATTTNLDSLAILVNSGISFSGKYFLMVDDLAYTYDTLNPFAPSTSTETNYTAIGYAYKPSSQPLVELPFNGHFDGDGHTISGIRIYKPENTTENCRQGLFGLIGSGAEVKGIVLADAQIVGSFYIGGIAGINNGTVTDCHVTHSVTINNNVDYSPHYYGGVVGQNNGTVSLCSSSANIIKKGSSSYSVDYGGIVGYNNGGTMRDNVAVGVYVQTVNNRYGAIVGSSENGTLQRNYYNECIVGNSYDITPSGVGMGGSSSLSDVTENDGAVPGYNITFGEGVSSSTTFVTVIVPEHPDLQSGPYGNMADTVPETIYNMTKSGTTITLTGDLPSETPPTGYRYAFLVNGDPLATNTFVMPANNVTVTIGLGPVEWAGNGEESTPYQIAYPSQLDLLATRVNNGNAYSGQYFKVMNDLAYNPNVLTIDNDQDGTNESNFTPIGIQTGNSIDSNSGTIIPIYNSFDGHFDGDNKTISGIHLGSDLNNQGLFGIIGSGATVSNVILDDADITGCVYVAGIVAQNQGGSVSHCQVTNTVYIRGNNSIYYHGGIVGVNESSSEIINCTSSATLTAEDEGRYLGGLAGTNLGVMSYNLVANATIPSCGMNSHGAIVGHNDGTMSYNYYAGCTVAGTANATEVGCGAIFTYQVGVEDMPYDITANDGAVPGNVRTVTAPSDWMNVSDGWAFIASPLADNINPVATDTVEMIFSETEYDLYRLNPTSSQWENYKPHSGNAAPGFYLENGRGYLYATQVTETIVFNGNARDYNLSDTTEVVLGQGFNLVGNPFPRATWINKPYYTLNSDGSAVLTPSESTATPISPCYGVVVEASDSETVTFTITPPAQQHAHNNGDIQIALAQTVATRGNAFTKTIDNAIVSFNEGSELGKFYFGHQNANIYLPQGGQDYAIAFSDKQGEMPVNFKATEDGTYTLTVNPEGVEMAYLHLIDNLTGADVDLLTPPAFGHPLTEGDDQPAPSYTFTAKTTDYESRFKLVFSANGEDGPSTGSEAFAFVSNGNIIVNGEGILQIVDVMGRIVATHSGRIQCVPTAGMTSGVYVLRLINGDDVKVQKIVID